MNCQNHPLRQGVNTCCICGHWLCDECSTAQSGRICCKGCLTGKSKRVSRGESFPNAFLLVLFSVLPGANYMYMGLIKRGLCVMTAFFLSIYMSGFFNIFGFIIPIVVITSFFDGLSIRRKLIAGEPVSDDINDLKAFFLANKLPILGLAGLMIGMEIFQNTARWFYRGAVGFQAPFGRGVPHGVIALAIILIGIYFISKLHKGKTPEDRKRDLQ